MFNTGNLITCEGCTPPTILARRKGTTSFEIIKYLRGQPVKVHTEYNGGSYTITCDKCRMGHIFMHFNEGMSCVDSSNSELNPDL